MCLHAGHGYAIGCIVMSSDLLSLPSFRRPRSRQAPARHPPRRPASLRIEKKKAKTDSQQDGAVKKTSDKTRHARRPMTPVLFERREAAEDYEEEQSREEEEEKTVQGATA